MEIIIISIHEGFILKLIENNLFRIKYTKDDIAYLKLLIDILPQEDEELAGKSFNHKRKSKRFKFFLYEDPKLSKSTLKNNRYSVKYDKKQEK